MSQMKPKLDLTSVYAKLGRAEEHFQLLDAEIVTWHNLCKDSFTIERGAYNTRVGLAIKMDGPPGDFLRWTLIAGDCINNARSALEHMVYAVGEYESIKNLTTDHQRNQFIIADSPADFAVEAKGRLKCLTPAVIAAIESVQPYNRTHPVLPPLLQMLRKFSNADKHRLLQLAASGVSITSGTIIGDIAKGRKRDRYLAFAHSR